MWSNETFTRISLRQKYGKKNATNKRELRWFSGKRKDESGILMGEGSENEKLLESQKGGEESQVNIYEYKSCKVLRQPKSK